VTDLEGGLPGIARSGGVFERLERAPRRLVLGLAWTLLVAFTWFDYWSGPDVSFLAFYLVPLYLTATYVGRPSTVLLAFACAIAWMLPRGILHPELSQGRLAWNLAVKTVLFQVCGQLLHALRRAHDRRVDETIRIEHARMAHLLGLLPEGVALVHSDGALLAANDAALRLARLQGHDTVHELARALQIPSRLAVGPNATEEIEVESHGRVILHVVARRSLGEPVAWVIRDVTEERTVLAHAIHESKMAELGLLAAGIAHELGNPLSSLSAIVQLLQARPLASDVAERIGALHGHVQRMDRIVKRVTRFARKSSARRDRAVAGTVLDRALDIFRFHEKAKEIDVDSAAFDRGLAVRMGEDELVQTLLNLLLNAVDAQSGRGRIDLRTEATASEIRLSVTDHGTGIDPRTLPRLFTPFFTTKEPGRGTGLGLAVSQTLVVASGGRIEVESAMGQGSTFSICLPPADDAAEAPP